MKNIKEKLDIVIDACEEKNGIDIVALNIGEKSSIADYFVIVSGNSTTQVKAIGEEIDDKMYENGFMLSHKEGHNLGRWILQDYGDIVVHILHKDEREYYKLENLWDVEEN